MQLNEIIHNALSGVVPAYPMIAPETAQMPFVIYGYKKKPKRTKEGIYAYENETHFIVVDNDLDNMEVLAEAVKQNIEALKGVEKIRSVSLEGEEQDYLPEARAFKVEIDFVIIQNV